MFLFKKFNHVLCDPVAVRVLGALSDELIIVCIYVVVFVLKVVIEFNRWQWLYKNFTFRRF
jgi:hypothetical protein